MNSLLSANNISVVRNGQKILDDVSIEIKQHDFVTLIGPNGAGKSMLLKCLLGFYTADSGKVIRAKNLRTAYVPQALNTISTMPITVNRFLHLRQNFTPEYFQQTIQETQIENLINRPLQVLSGGEMQRILLARALLSSPQLLVLDEPAQNLDISGQLSFYKLIDTVYKRHDLSILMVSHDLHLVMASTQHVVCLYHHVCCTGTPSVITQDPEFISLFGDEMGQMMAMYQHSHQHNNCDHHHS